MRFPAVGLAVLWVLTGTAVTIGAGGGAQAQAQAQAQTGTQAEAKMEAQAQTGAEDHSGQVAYTLTERDLFLEGIAHDPVTGALFVSSLYKDKIVRIAPSSAGPLITDFISPGQHGFMSGVGMAVDPERRLLYALCGLMGAESAMANGLYVFDLDGRLLHRTVVQDTARAMWNDIVVASNGTAYFTDTERGTVYTFTPGANRITPWAECAAYPNGLALSPDENTLYVATFQEGIQRIDLATGEAASALAPGAEADSRGIDGLMLHHDPGTGRSALLGIQNAFRTRSRHAIMRYPLDGAGLITGAEVLDRNHPLFNVPTTGVVAGNILYCIANSQLDDLDQEAKSVPEPGALEDPVILRYDLAP